MYAGPYLLTSTLYTRNSKTNKSVIILMDGNTPLDKFNNILQRHDPKQVYVLWGTSLLDQLINTGCKEADMLCERMVMIDAINAFAETNNLKPCVLAIAPLYNKSISQASRFFRVEVV
jgi:hypothetical protein